MNETKERISALAETAGDFVESAATDAGRQYDEARKGMSSVLERGKDLYGSACKRALKETRAADGVMHEHLYRAILLGIGAGVIIGFLASRRN